MIYEPEAESRHKVGTGYLGSICHAELTCHAELVSASVPVSASQTLKQVQGDTMEPRRLPQHVGWGLVAGSRGNSSIKIILYN